MLRKIGIFLLSGAFVLFFLSLWMNKYSLSKDILSKYLNPDQNKIAQEYLKPILVKEYNYSWDFAYALSSQISLMNHDLDQKRDWNNKIYEDTALLLMKDASFGFLIDNKEILFLLLLSLIFSGGLLMIFGVKAPSKRWYNNKWWSSILGLAFILFYILLYFFPHYIVNWILIFDPLSEFLNGKPAGRWFFYGTLYTLAVLVMGIRFIKNYKSNYQKFRTFSLIFFQLCFAFIIPELLSSMNLPAVDFKNMWPLDYSFFFDYRLSNLLKSGKFGVFVLIWGILLFVVVTPMMVYFFGKRWYCSWVCGCGGLAETLGDPFRHLSNSSQRAWKIEKMLIYPILGFSILMTSGVIYTFITGSYTILGFVNTDTLRSIYGFWIGSIFSGVVGTGFYPIMGNRIWCRFGCPLAAYLGILQKFKSKFRITSNGGQCISCGNCTTHCEMGIDVRAYAQKGEDIVRASCVGCGICATVCPRGVLNLENLNP